MIAQFLADVKNSLAPDRVMRVIKGPAWLLLVIGTVSNLIAVFTSLFTLLVYDKVFPHNGTSTLIVLTMGMCALLAIDVGMRMLRTSVINRALFGPVQRTGLAALRERFRVQGKGFEDSGRKSYLDKAIEDLGDLQPSDVKTATLTVDLPFAGVLLLAIFLIAGQLVWVPLIAMVVLITIIALTHKKFKAASRELEKERRHAIEMFAFLSRGADWLFGVSGWQWLVDKEGAAKQRIAASSAQVAQYSNMRQLSYQTILQLVSVATLFFGFFLFQSGAITLGGVIATYMLTNRVLTPIGTIAQMMSPDLDGSSKERTPSAAASEPLLDVQPGQTDWQIDLTTVTFTYAGKSAPAFRSPSLRIKAGEHVAVIGRSASGKTTLAKILCRSLDGVEGAVTWNQLPISSINEDSWEKFCLYVPQTPWLGQGSLFDQIRLGDATITDAAIAQAIRQAGLEDMFVADQKTISGDGFSAGQMQLLGLLRCLTRRSSLLILDEPTNFLDEDTEKKVIRAIMERYQSATILLITHRKSLLSYMDRALVVDGGAIVRDAQIDKAPQS
uniref:ATP-binding cassette domain-containing protein n=1 Tax=Polynucleobacter sp. TaxID=2029855 RepID=UPI00404779E4